MATEVKARNEENQPLIDALLRLSKAEGTASNLNKANFRAAALRRAARGLARKSTKITSGESVSQGPGKVKGVGPGTAYYIDEFLANGEIAEIDQFEQQQSPDQKQDSSQDPNKEGGQNSRESTEGNKEEDEKAEQTAEDKKTNDQGIITINRAPVLTLWATVVAERLGYSRDEAVTYGKWMAGIMAHAKGKAEGRFADDTAEGPPSKVQKTKQNDYVQIFRHMKVPVIKDDESGQRFARDSSASAQDAEPMDPISVHEYLERAFGDQLERVKQAMHSLADSMPKDELCDKGYPLYENFRPAYKGWGKKSDLHLEKFYELAHE